MSTSILPNALPTSRIASPGHFLLVTDHSSSSGQFILHRVLTGGLKAEQCSCLLVSLGEPWDHWKTIAGKMGVNLTPFVSSQFLGFVDGLSLIHPPDETPALLLSDQARSKALLRNLMHKIASSRELLRDGTSKILVIDDVSILEWLDIPPVELLRFWRAVLALKDKMAVGLVARQTVDASAMSVVTDLLLGSCNAHVEVSPLSSGRSSAVTGEISVQNGPFELELEDQAGARRRSMQYRLTDTGPVWIERGTGGGVL